MSDLAFKTIRDLCIDIIKESTSGIPDEFRSYLISQVSRTHDDVMIPEDFEICFENARNDVKLKNAEGDKEFKNAGNDIMLENAGKDVMLENAEGDKEFKNAGKDVMLENIGGDIEFENAGKDVMLENIGSDKEFKNAGNDVMLENAEGDKEFKNAGNDIEAAVASHFLLSGFAAHLNFNLFDNGAIAILVGDALLTLAGRCQFGQLTWRNIKYNIK